MPSSLLRIFQFPCVYFYPNQLLSLYPLFTVQCFSHIYRKTHICAHSFTFKIRNYFARKTLPTISHSAAQTLDLATPFLLRIHKINTVHLLTATERYCWCTVACFGVFSNQLLQILCPWLLKGLSGSSSHSSYLLGHKTQRKLLWLQGFSHYRKLQGTTYLFPCNTTCFPNAH